MNLNDLFNEEKVRLDPKCWTGKKIGNPKTKMKGGTRVNNCVPAESVNEMDKSQTPPGRDGSNDSDAGKKEYTAKATTAKKVAKDAEKILNKELNKKPGVAEGKPQKKADRYHITNKDGKPATLSSYPDKESAVKDRDAKHPAAKVQQVGPRGRVKGEFEEGVAEGLNTGPQIIYATGPRTMGANDVDLVFKDLRTGKIVAHVVGNNNSLQEFAIPDGGEDGGNLPERPATYEIRMNNSKAPTYVAFGDPNQDSEHKVYKLGPKQPGAQAYYGMGITLVSNLDWWSFLEKMLGEIMAEDDAIESGLVDRKGDGDLVFVKQQGVAEEYELAGVGVAYELGRRAYKQGMTIRDNPYSATREARKNDEWAKGLERGKHDANDARHFRSSVREQGVAEAGDSNFVGFMNKTLADKVDAPKADPMAGAPDFYRNAAVSTLDARRGFKNALKFGLKALSRLDPETRQQLAAGSEQAVEEYLTDVAERSGQMGDNTFVEEDITEVQDYLGDVFHDPNINSWKDVLQQSQGMSDGQLDEKSVSQAQFRTMAAAAHNPKFAKKVGISRDVAKEFHGADRKQDYTDLPKKADESKSAPKEKEADYGDDYQDMVARVKKLAGLGPMKTVYDPAKRVYRNVPTAVQPKR